MLFETPPKKSRNASGAVLSSRKKKKKKAKSKDKTTTIDAPSGMFYTFAEAWQITKNATNRKQAIKTLIETQKIPLKAKRFQQQMQDRLKLWKAQKEKEEWPTLPLPSNKSTNKYTFEEAIDIFVLYQETYFFRPVVIIELMKDKKVLTEDCTEEKIINARDNLQKRRRRRALNKNGSPGFPVHAKENDRYDICEAGEDLEGSHAIFELTGDPSITGKTKNLPENQHGYHGKFSREDLYISTNSENIAPAVIVTPPAEVNKIALVSNPPSSHKSFQDSICTEGGLICSKVIITITNKLQERKSDILTMQEEELLKALLGYGKKKGLQNKGKYYGRVLDIGQNTSNSFGWKIAVLPSKESKAESGERKKAYQRKFAKDLYLSLPDKVLEPLLKLYLKNNTDSLLSIIDLNSRRLNVTESSVISKFVGLSRKQSDKLNRAFFYYFGFRPLCSKLARLDYFREKELSSAKHDDVILSKRTSKDATSFKDITCPRYQCDALEHINRDITDLIVHNAMLSSKECFHCPFDDSKFQDVIKWKIGIDAGGGSTKLIINCCNVQNPQSLEHTHLVALFKYAKDTYPNLKKAFFHEGSLVKKRIESIINQCCVTLVVHNKKKKAEAVTFVDTSRLKEESPNRLPPPSVCDLRKRSKNTTVTDTRAVSFVDIKESFFVIDDKKVTGIEFHDSNGKYCAGASFSDPFCAEEFKEEDVTICQYLHSGVLSGDYEVLCSLFGHVGANAKRPCIWCHVTNKNLGTKKSDIINSEKLERTLENIQDQYKKHKDLEEKVPLHSKERKKNLHQETHSIRSEPLLNIDPRLVAIMFLHLILGFGKKANDSLLFMMEAVDLMGTSPQIKQKKSTLSMIRDKLDAKIEYFMEQSATIKNKFVDIMKKEEEYNDFATARRNLAESFLGGTHVDHSQNLLHKKKAEAYEEQAKDLFKDFKKEEFEEDELQSLNALFVAKENRKEVDEFLSSWVGFSKNTLFDTLREHGIDEQVYHGGALVGRDILTYCEKYEDIFEDINEAYMDEGFSQEQVSAIRKITDRWEEVWKHFAIFAGLITTTRRLSPEEIKSVRTVSDDLHTVLTKMVTDPPILLEKKDKIQFKKSVKFHCIFSHHVTEFAEKFHALGLFAEQNVESIHAEYNIIGTRCSAVRGVNKMFTEMHYFESCRNIEASNEMKKMKEASEKFTDAQKEERKKERQIKNGKDRIERRAARKERNINRLDDTNITSNLVSSLNRIENTATEDLESTFSPCKKCGKMVMDIYKELHNFHAHQEVYSDLAGVKK